MSETATPLPPLAGFNLDNTLGAILIAIVIAAGFYGLTTLQTYFYFTTYHNDRFVLKSLVSLLWILDGLHLALITHAVYFYIVTNFGNLEAMADLTWSGTGETLAVALTLVIIRGIFAYRIWKLGRRVWLTSLITILTLMSLVTDILLVIKGAQIRAFSEFWKISWAIFLACTAIIVSDSAIAISFFVLFFRSRTGFKRTDSILQRLMIYSINTGAFTCICALACLIAYITMPHNLVFLAIHVMLPKLYLNSLLATLNARRSLRHRDPGELLSIPLPHPNTTAASSAGARSTFDDIHLSPVIIQVEKTTDLKVDRLSDTCQA